MVITKEGEILINPDGTLEVRNFEIKGEPHDVAANVCLTELAFSRLRLAAVVNHIALYAHNQMESI
jgi:hypothetical protein